MLKPDTKIKVPISLAFYRTVRIMLFIGLLISPFMIMAGFDKWIKFWGGLWISPGIFILIWMIISTSKTSFTFNDQNITKYWGVFFKESVTVPLSTIQNISTAGGPLLGMFGLSMIMIWTSSPSQILIRNGNSYNSADLGLRIKKGDAEWLQEYLMKKSHGK